MPIELRPYDPAWPMRADQACAQLAAAVPGLFSAIEHIGSTAVPGLTAKPVTDLMAATDDLDVVVEREEAIGALGFQRVANGMPKRLFYRRVDEHGRVHLHVVTADSWPTRNERLLRDHLRRRPEEAARYAAAKQALTQLDAEGYTRGKTDVVQELVDRARGAAGLPSVPVWEE